MLNVAIIFHLTLKVLDLIWVKSHCTVQVVLRMNGLSCVFIICCIIYEYTHARAARCGGKYLGGARLWDLNLPVFSKSLISCYLTMEAI